MKRKSTLTLGIHLSTSRLTTAAPSAESATTPRHSDAAGGRVYLVRLSVNTKQGGEAKTFACACVGARTDL
jgi:hypothetical protein